MLGPPVISALLRACFRVRVGMGSEAHELEGEFWIVFLIDSNDTSAKSDMEQVQEVSILTDIGGMVVPIIPCRKLSILSIK